MINSDNHPTVLSNDYVNEIFSYLKDKNSFDFLNKHPMPSSVLSELRDLGLIEKVEKKYVFTFLGKKFFETLKIVYDLHNIFQKLNIVGIIDLSDANKKEEVIQLIDLLIDDGEIKEIVRKMSNNFQSFQSIE